MDTEVIKQKLKNEGFKYVYEWTDGPGVEYPEHSHKGKVSFYLTKGSITMNMGGVKRNVGLNERVDVPIGISHTAKVGSEGCTFIVGEEIQGDS